MWCSTHTVIVANERDFYICWCAEDSNTVIQVCIALVHQVQCGEDSGHKQQSQRVLPFCGVNPCTRNLHLFRISHHCHYWQNWSGTLSNYLFSAKAVLFIGEQASLGRRRPYSPKVPPDWQLWNGLDLEKRLIKESSSLQISKGWAEIKGRVSHCCPTFLKRQTLVVTEESWNSLFLLAHSCRSFISGKG